MASIEHLDVALWAAVLAFLPLRDVAAAACTCRTASAAANEDVPYRARVCRALGAWPGTCAPTPARDAADGLRAALGLARHRIVARVVAKYGVLPGCYRGSNPGTSRGLFVRIVASPDGGGLEAHVWRQLATAPGVVPLHLHEHPATGRLRLMGGVQLSGVLYVANRVAAAVNETNATGGEPLDANARAQLAEMRMWFDPDALIEPLHVAADGIVAAAGGACPQRLVVRSPAKYEQPRVHPMWLHAFDGEEMRWLAALGDARFRAELRRYGLDVDGDSGGITGTPQRTLPVEALTRVRAQLELPDEMALERLPPTEPPAEAAALAASSHPWLAPLLRLPGYWRAPYGSHGLELLHLAIEVGPPPQVAAAAAEVTPQPAAAAEAAAAADASSSAAAAASPAASDGAADAAGAAAGDGGEGGHYRAPPRRGRPRMALFAQPPRQDGGGSGGRAAYDDDDGGMMPPPPRRPRSTIDLANDPAASAFWGAAAAASLPDQPALRGPGGNSSSSGDGDDGAASTSSAPPPPPPPPPVRLVLRKVIGDPNVPSGQYSVVADLGAAGRRDPAQAARPGRPVLTFTAAGPQPVALDDKPVLDAYDGWGQINSVPSAWAPQWTPGTLFAYADGSLAFLWRDESDFFHATTFERFAPANEPLLPPSRPVAAAAAATASSPPTT